MFDAIMFFCGPPIYRKSCTKPTDTREAMRGKILRIGTRSHEWQNTIASVLHFLTNRGQRILRRNVTHSPLTIFSPFAFDDGALAPPGRNLTANSQKMTNIFILVAVGFFSTVLTYFCLHGRGERSQWFLYDLKPHCVSIRSGIHIFKTTSRRLQQSDQIGTLKPLKVTAWKQLLANYSGLPSPPPSSSLVFLRSPSFTVVMKQKAANWRQEPN